MIGPLFYMFTAAMFTVFLQDSQICASLEQHSTSFEELTHLDWYFMEMG